jgi:hypothetical protein
VAKKKQSHREIFRYFETWIYLPHKGIAPASDAALMLLHSILKPYAVAEQAEADAKKAQDAPVDAQKGSPRDDSVSNGYRVIAHEFDPPLTTEEFVAYVEGLER